MAFPVRREERAQRRLISSPSGTKAVLQKLQVNQPSRKRNKRHTRRLQLIYDQKEQTQWQDDGTVLSLPPWAWCKVQCHEPNSTAEYFHQAPPDSPPHTLAGPGVAHRWGLPYCPVILYENRVNVFPCCIFIAVCPCVYFSLCAMLL